MFIGEYEHTIDKKGRIAVPYRFRKLLKEGAVVAKGLVDKCLCVYPKEEWEKLSTKLAGLPLSDPKARAFTRLMFSGAVNVGFDRQGRILLPAYLREYSGLKSQAVVSGVYSRVEIWDAKKWKEYKDKSEAGSDDISKHMIELGV
ncbi:MAG: division/cell wall cluster transcriptional repressor MraZ [Candidatus Berkelbacteria bacterium]|nr:division/cell wall cluster transcriptional repressor MraZ [Candidatus Berkelbacteria bacterium]